MRPNSQKGPGGNRAPLQPISRQATRHRDSPRATVPWVRLGVVAFMAAVLITGLARAHGVPSTEREQRSGLEGRASHLQRVLRVKRHGMRFVVNHRREYNGKAGQMWWHLAREATRARRRLVATRRRIAARQVIPSWALALFQCESQDGANARSYRGYTIDWTYAKDYHGAGNWLVSTWLRVGGGRYASMPEQATPYEQYLVLKLTVEREGWGSFPACSSMLGYR